MTLIEKLIMGFNELTEIEQQEVIDFVGYLRYKREKILFNVMDGIVDENEVALKKLSK